MGRFPNARGFQSGCTGTFEKIDEYVPAMAYVPWQRFTKPYSPEEGLKKGTLFGELDKPFQRARCKGK